MRRPLVIIVVLYTCGLMLAEVVQPPLMQLFGPALALALLALGWRQARAWLLFPLVILFAWANLVSRTSLVSPHDLRVLLPTEPAEISVRGRLTETPSVRLFIRDEEESFRTLAKLEVTSIRQGGNWIPAYGRLMTTTPGDLNGFAYAGTEVELRGVVERPSRPLAEGLFDYRTYLARQGIYFQLRTGGTNEWQLLSPAIPTWSDRFMTWAQRTLARGQPERDEPLLLLYAMTLGWKTGLVDEVYEPFIYSGTMHIFAISGLHVALIAGILVALLRVVRIPRRWCGVIVIPLLWFYTAATGWQPSAIRSTIMMSVIVLGWSLARPTDLINSLATAALIILVWDPQQIFQASFQLSFCVVLSIALLTPPLKRLSDRLLAHDPLLPREALPRWRRWLGTPLRWLALSFATSLAAWLGSLPLTAHYFHVFSPVTLLANILIVPTSGAALASSLASLLCGGWLPGASEWFNHGSWFWMSLMMRISQWAASLPGAFRYMAAPPAWGFAAYYLILIGTLSGWFFRAGHRVWGVLAIVAVVGGSGWEWKQSQERIEVTILPLNGGHAVYVDAPGTANDWLMDCGDTNSVEFITKPFLHARGVNHLPRLLLTHGDLQHAGGTRLIWEAFRVDQTYTSPVSFRSGVYRALIADLASTPEQHVEVRRGDKAGLWNILHPAEHDKFPQADDASLVLLAQFHETRLLLLGDLGRPGQEALMRWDASLDADIVVAGLPERGEAMCNGLIARTAPERTIIADSEFPATKRATRVIQERLSRSGAHPVFTRKLGAINITIRPAGFELRSMENPD
jgi:competence protein ComEC